MHQNASLPQLHAATDGFDGDGTFRASWRADTRKLLGNELRVVSPLIEVPCGTMKRPMAFRFLIRPAGAANAARQRTFKKAGGKGTIQLKCESELCGVDARVSFCISIGNTLRGPFQHDFKARPVYDLPEGLMEWDFGSAIRPGDNTVLVRLKLLPRDPPVCLNGATSEYGGSPGNSGSVAVAGPVPSAEVDDDLCRSLSSCAASDAADATKVQTNSPRRKRSEAGRMSQLVRWRNRLASHGQMRRSPKATVVNASRGLTGSLPQNPALNDGEHTGEQVASAPIESWTDSQETEMRPTFREMLCQGSPRRAVSVKSSRDR